MKAASLNEIKKGLAIRNPQQLFDLCAKLAKYKTENKELLSYLLFDAENEQAYIQKVKNNINELFEELNKGNHYTAVKGIRKILKIVNRHIKFSAQRQTETELLIHFCIQLKNSGVRIYASTALTNLYEQQIKKINKAISTLHEDLQFDYQQELEQLDLFSRF